MGKIRRGNFVFTTWIGDHVPLHVHIHKDKKLICKYDLTNGRVMSGKVSARLKKLISELVDEGEL